MFKQMFIELTINFIISVLCCIWHALLTFVCTLCYTGGDSVCVLLLHSESDRKTVHHSRKVPRRHCRVWYVLPDLHCSSGKFITHIRLVLLIDCWVILSVRCDMAKAFQNILHIFFGVCLSKRVIFIDVTKIPFYFVRIPSASICKG